MSSKLVSFFYLTLLVALGWLAYEPGLHGTFLFDDFNNLNSLGAFGKIDNWNTLLLYLTSGEADPTGRPLSLLSFLIDAQNWPANPEPFISTNILLHLLNGGLLVWVLLRLGQAIGLTEKHAISAASLGAAFWLLHPLFVSTTLYIVQREAMLPATFTLIGMGSWLKGRQLIHTGQRTGWPLLISSAWGCTLLATLSKGNGALLPLLLLLMQWLIPSLSGSNTHLEKRLRQATILLLGVPSILLGLWLLLKIPADLSAVPYGRPWSVGQRLLSEPRILMGYLRLLWLPQASLSGLFNDGIVASKDWLNPWTTMPAIIAIAALIGFGFAIRIRHPAIAFSILFYFTGQLLESTVIPLELSFEHRNYLPAIPMFWPLAIWLTGAGAMQRMRAAICIVTPLILLALTHARATGWGKPFDQALLFATVSPNSPRAQINAAQYEAANGQTDLAIQRLETAAEHFPSEPQVSLNLINVRCSARGITSANVDLAVKTIAQNTGQADFIHRWVLDHVEIAATNKCTGLDLAALQKIMHAVRDNPFYLKGNGHQRDMDHADGQIALANGNAELAFEDFKKAITLVPTPDLALTQAALLGTSGHPELGLRHIQYFRTLTVADNQYHGMLAVHSWLLKRQGYWTSELSRVQNMLQADVLKSKGTRGTELSR